MLHVKSLDESKMLLKKRFSERCMSCETVPLEKSIDRILFADILSKEHVPGFDRSSVDGYAVMASDTFGCSESLPALLKNIGAVEMGEIPAFTITKGCCCYVPTGGAMPRGADAMVMIEYTETLPDGSIAVEKPSAPGAGIIYKGDDIKPGDIILKAGKRLLPKDIGALAAMGETALSVYKKPRIAVLSTGDELVLPDQAPSMGQIRDVNQSLLLAALVKTGAEPVGYGIIKDMKGKIKNAVAEAVDDYDMVLVSGGTSVGIKDVAEEVLGELGEVLLHGIALKPGKPTIAADVHGKPVIWLPGHPAAAYFVYMLLVEPLLFGILGCTEGPRKESFTLMRTVPSNHGREECMPVSISGGHAVPIPIKSGLITTLSRADGFFIINRDSEGIKQGDRVNVILF